MRDGEPLLYVPRDLRGQKPQGDLVTPLLTCLGRKGNRGLTTFPDPAAVGVVLLVVFMAGMAGEGMVGGTFLGFALKFLGFAPQFLGFALELLGFALKLLGFVRKLLGFAPELLGFAPQLLGFALTLLGFAPTLLGFIAYAISN